MKLCTVQAKGLEPFFGVEIKSRVLRIAAAASAYGLRPAQRETLASMEAYLGKHPHSEKTLRAMLARIVEDPAKAAGKCEAGLPLLVPREELRFLPPVVRPGKILCVGLNYKDHCEEQNKPVPEAPILFNKFATSLIGHEADIPLPLDLDEQMDYEAELAVVIGKGGKAIPKRRAMAHVAGFMPMNDVSARTLQSTERQWARAKGFDGSGPCGPSITTPDEVGDPHKLVIKCRLNGAVVQKSNTRHLVFDIPALIAHASAAMTLEPGDIISTGTPGGVGVYRDPQVFLRPGDEVCVEIERVGVLRNRCVKA